MTNCSVTYLFVPGDHPQFFDKACISGSDVLILDLEDSVHPLHKSLARQEVMDWLLHYPKKEVTQKIAIRINQPNSIEYDQDIDWLKKNNLFIYLSHLVIPKVESVAMINDVKKYLFDNPQLSMIAIIETAWGLHRVYDIAHSGVERLAFGSLDFSLDMQCDMSRESLLFARTQVVLASRLANLLAPIDCVTPDIDDLAALEQECLHAKALGFTAKLAIHPYQIAIIKRSFDITQQQLAWSKKVLQQSQEQYAFKVDGKMVDLPLILQAKKWLNTHK
ncbi:HpcH/HpaI aldolase/citrate lyase family protein [Providencia stuartii]|uniref:HpcH/HpaI aldolase/citrate lyase family protein n=1 Tax=Providencia stuartii TaxID=588 RepID=UPI0012B5B9C7|nr:CoA ester lyase [Providencia stuartii]MCR4080974.1 CoA ester lyase [Providencia stuartii]MTB81073.1 CoA ester lyase [Providencia stuartii]